MLRSGMKESYESIPYLWNRYTGAEVDEYNRILPPLPRGRFRSALADYARKSVFQFIPDFSAGGTVVHYRIDSAIEVGEGLNTQVVCGRIVKVESDDPDSVELRAWKELEGKVMEARVFDPVHINLFDQVPNFKDPRDCGPIRGYVLHDRRRSCFLEFEFYRGPLERFSTVVIPGQHNETLGPRPYYCRVFFPHRELVDESAAAVILTLKIPGARLADVTCLMLDHEKADVLTNAEAFFRAFRSQGWFTNDFVDKLLLDKDGQLRFDPGCLSSIARSIPVPWIVEEMVVELHKRFKEISSQ
jgi:hypothetical protein